MNNVIKEAIDAVADGLYPSYVADCLDEVKGPENVTSKFDVKDAIAHPHKVITKFDYNDDLPSKQAEMFGKQGTIKGMPSADQLRMPPIHKMISAAQMDYFMQGKGERQYSKTEPAPTPFGKTTAKFPRPEISREHLDYLTTASKGQEASRHWYEKAQTSLKDVFDGPCKECGVVHYKDHELFSGLLASNSQQAHPYQNFMKALRHMRDLVGEKPLVGLHPEVQNTIRAAHGLQQSGPKIHWFNRNLAQRDPSDTSAPTIDRHMLRGVMHDYSIPPSPRPEHMAAGHETLHAVGSRLGWPVHNVQAAAWAHVIRRGGVNDPSWHQSGSPFKRYSQRFGGHLPVIENPTHVQDYEQFLHHNREAITQMKVALDHHRLNHPEFKKYAGSSKPFLFSPKGPRGAMKYGPQAIESPGGKSVKHTLVDRHGRDIQYADPHTGWPVKPGEEGKLVKQSFLKK